MTVNRRFASAGLMHHRAGGNSAAAVAGPQALVDALDAAATWTSYYICEASYLTLSGSEITQWEDASGNALHLTPASTGPAYSATGSANGNGLATPGSPGRMLVTGTPDVNGKRLTMWGLGQPNSGQHGFGTVGYQSIVENLGRVTAITSDGGSGYSEADATFDGSEHCYMSGMRASPHGTFEVDGATQAVVTDGSGAVPASYTTLHVMTDGFLSEPGYPTSFFGYAQLEFTPAEIADVEAALSNFYGTTFA